MGIETIITLVLIGLSSLVSVICSIDKRKTERNIKNCVKVSLIGDTQQTEVIEDDSEPCEKPLQVFAKNLKKIIGYIVSAEKIFTPLSSDKVGYLKFQDVITKLKVDCLTDNEEFNEKEYTNIIEDLITFSKSVNVDKKSNQLDKSQFPTIVEKSNEENKSNQLDNKQIKLEDIGVE